MSNVDKYSLFPLTDLEMYKLGKKQEARIWSIADLKSLVVDREDYRHRADYPKKRIIEKVHCLFVPFDGVINIGHMTRTINDCTDPCEQFAMCMQFQIEAVHAETYGLSAQIIFGNDKLKELKIEAQNTQAIKDKIAFAEKYTKHGSLCEYLLAFACSEGIFISVSFIFIFWFRSKEMFPSLIHANSMISEDEEIHQSMANKRYLKHGGLSEARAMEIILEAMAIEERYIEWVLPEDVDDLKVEDVKTYLKLVVDYQLTSIGLPKLFNVQNPFSWDLDRSLYKKPNPYERESGQYCRFSVNEIIDRVLSSVDKNTDNTHLTDPWAVEGI